MMEESAFVALRRQLLNDQLQLGLSDKQAAARILEKDRVLDEEEGVPGTFTSRAWGVSRAMDELKPMKITRRLPLAHEVLIDILFSGMCRSDEHHVRNDWNDSQFPMVPGHEICGRVRAVGDGVTKLRVGMFVAVGNLVDSCRECDQCEAGSEQLCTSGGPTWTYNSHDRFYKGRRWLLPHGLPTMGGYSDSIVCDENYVLRIPPKLTDAATLPRVAPLLCAGITVFNPLFTEKVAGKTVGVAGVGGLGHLAVKMARALGASVIAFTTSAWKLKHATKKLGAQDAVLSLDAADRQRYFGKLDLLLDTVPVPHDLDQYAELLKPTGKLVVLGNMNEFTKLTGLKFVFYGKSLRGSNTGGIQMTQDCLDFCAAKDILPDVEVVAAHEINQAMRRMVNREAAFRMVIDASTF